MALMNQILKLMADKNASDVYLSASAPALIKINGQSVPINSQLLTANAIHALLSEILPQPRIDELESSGELNIALTLPSVGRFRISAMRQRGSYAVVIRYIANDVPPLAHLKLPPVLSDLIMQKRGLVLMVGATGTGKSTTLAAMIDHRNENVCGHILTIEDPIEFFFKNKKSVVNQREVGADTATFQVALKNALRQAPDVIMIGEIRDRDTMDAALTYSQTGHLCLATMHANNSYQALNRILNFYPQEVRSTMLSDLAASLKAIVSQRLLRALNGQRVAAVEILINSMLVAEFIEKGDFVSVKEAMEKSTAEGSQMFEAHIAQLIAEGVIDRSEGLAHADSPNNLMWRLQNSSGKVAAPVEMNSTKHEAEMAEEAQFTHISLDVSY